MSDILVARQPVYNSKLEVFAYELLYRSNAENNFYDGGTLKDDESTYEVIANSFLEIGIEKLTGSKRGFINFSANVLKSGIVTRLPKEYIGIEILETVKVTPEIIEICKELRKSGYMIILDDFVLTEQTEPLIKTADMIKMDFLLSSDEELKSIVKKYNKYKISFLAEKIESKERFELAKKWGYKYFQGYYFQKPQIVSQKVLKPLYVNIIKILDMLNAEEECDTRELIKFIEYDPAITYKILRIVNSVMYRGFSEITNISQAIARIGFQDLKTCMVLVLVNGLDRDKPNELIRLAMVRARMCELIAEKIGLNHLKESFSLMGLISLMDALINAPMSEVLESFKLSKNIENALLNIGNDKYSQVITLIKFAEKAEWKIVTDILTGLNLSEKVFADIQIEAIEWVDNKFSYIKY